MRRARMARTTGTAITTSAARASKPPREPESSRDATAIAAPTAIHARAASERLPRRSGMQRTATGINISMSPAKWLGFT